MFRWTSGRPRTTCRLPRRLRAEATRRQARGGLNLSAMSTETTVAQFMTTNPATADEELRLADAQERMFLNNIRHLVVHRAGRVTGLLSTRDSQLALGIRGADPKDLTVADAMSREPFTCGPDTPISAVALEMEAHRYGCAIVIEGNELLGVFTTTDALRALRQYATGKPAEPAVKPTHNIDHSHDVRHHIQLRKHRPIDEHGQWPNSMKIR